MQRKMELVRLLAAAACAGCAAASESYEEELLPGAGDGSGEPEPPWEFTRQDWVYASLIVAAVAVMVCCFVVAWKPWNDANCVACVDGCAFKTLFCQNIIDALVGFAFFFYGFYIAVAHNAHPAVYVPILAIAGLFALLVAISSIAAKERCCRCCLPVGSGIGMILALGEVFLGIAAWAKPATVLSWLQSMEDDSPESVPRSVSEHFVSSSRTVAVVLWVMASLQFIRAVISLVIECHHWRQGRKHAGGYLQAGEDNFLVDGRSGAGNYFSADDITAGGRITWGNSYSGKTRAEYDDFLYDSAKEQWPLDD